MMRPVRPGFVTNNDLCTPSIGIKPTGVAASMHHDQELSTMEQAHVDMIMSFNSAFNLQRPRSLDHYFHRDLTQAELQSVNAEQVLSRFIHHQQAKRRTFLEQKDPSHGIGIPKPRGIFRLLRKVLTALSVLGMASSGSEDTRVEHGPDKSNIKSHLSRQHIVVVPQLWLWKIDSKSQGAAHITPGALDSTDPPRASPLRLYQMF